MDTKTALKLRQFIRDCNALGVKYGHDKIAGDVDSPDQEWIDMFDDGYTPEKAIYESVGYLRD